MSLAIVMAGFAYSGSGLAQDTVNPLRMEGKSTLYQRVLTRLGAEIRAAPGSQGSVITRVPPLSVYYVYARQTADGAEWVQVGPSSASEISGWVSADYVVDWKQMLVGWFTNPANRYPALLYSDREIATEVLESEVGANLAKNIRANVDSGKGDPRVVAVEPAIYINPQKNYYLLPILDHFQADDDYATKVLKVAVVNKNAVPLQSTAEAQSDDLAGFKVAIAFVIDTTLSMGPYLEQTREAIRRVCEKTQTTQWRERFNFAMIAFRDSLQARPELEYTWKRIAPFKDGGDCDALLRASESAAEATVSSKGFTEDALAGMNAALTELDWSEFGGRYAVLITDASARDAGNRYSTTKLSAQQINSKARAQGVALLTLHLLTPEGRHDHERADRQYRTLSEWPNLQPFYYPLPADATEFGNAAEQLADALIGHLGEEVDSFLQQGATSRNIDQLGHAMRLAYLGRQQGVSAPEVFEGWIAERNAEDRSKWALDIRVLFTKDQLSDLQIALRQIIEAGDLTELAPEDFFAQLRKLLIVAQRDSAELARANSLGDSVVLGEYLEGLPYQSLLTSIDGDTWLALGAGERQELLDEIEAKIQLFQDIHDDQDLWVELDDGNVKGDLVYPISLLDLP
ncbi:MAG: serine/threonine protein kinase [Gammaproteobacteria bacterium]|nr:serine/threonine protein kinase [Gammaproteobacteria bacterium]